MPDLPTLSVTQKQADRALAAFGSIANYRAWLRRAVASEVLMVEGQRAVSEVKASIQADFPDDPLP